MALSIRCSTLQISENGAYDISFSDGNGRSFGSKEEIEQWAREVDGPENAGMMQKLAIRNWMVKDPSMTDLTPVLGVTLTLDMESAVPLRVG